MSETSSTYSNNGQFSLTKLSLFYHNDTDEELELNLTQAYITIDLYESIWNPVMTGGVSVVDSYNVSDIIELFGGERVEIEFYTAGNEKNPITLKAEVVKVSEKHRVSEHSSGYVIHFMSKAGMASQRSNVQKGYKSTCDKVVLDIFNTHLKSVTGKQLRSTACKGIQTYTFGFISPLEAIAIASRNAMSVDDCPGYIFYENNKEFVFESLHNLYAQEPVTEYIYRNASTFKDVSQRAVERFNAAQDIRVLEENSYLDRVMEGIHGSRHVYFDLETKDYNEIEYSKDLYFDETKSLGKKASKRNITNNSFSDVTSINFVSGNLDLTKDEVRSKMSKIESTGFRTNMTVFGDSYIKSGDVCYATIPNWNQEQEEVTDMISGKFLIADIHHNMTNNQYVQSLMIQKESYEDL